MSQKQQKKKKKTKKRRLWLNDGTCVRLRPERPNHVWSYDFVQDRTHDGRVYRTLNIIDEYTRKALNNGENFYNLREAQIMI